MNRHDLLLLQQISGYPALTITLPTHRTAPDNRQDPIRVKNLVNQAANQLLAEFSKREIEPVLTRLEHLAEKINYRHTLDGLAIFVNYDFAQAHYLPFSLNERVVVDQTFMTRDLVFAMNRTPRYWVLALSEQPTRLYEGTRETLVEIQSEGFPMTHEGPGGEQALPGGFGVQRSAHRDERHRQFFRAVDNALKPFLADDPLPLALVGVDRFLAFFTEVTSHQEAILTTIQGSHDKTSAYELGQLVWPPVKAALAERRQQYLVELENAVGAQKVASTAGEVWRFASEGRGQLLLVEEDFHFPGRLDESGLHLLPADDPTAPDVIADAVDEIIETVLSKGGRVIFTENSQLAKFQRIALILRY
jgi:hypothetical protein